VRASRLIYPSLPVVASSHGNLPHAVANVYSDAGISGTTTARPGLQRLLTDARSKRFKAVLVDDLSRLSGNRTDSDVLVRDLDDLGIKVVDTETGASSDEESSDVIFAVKGTHALERRADGGIHLTAPPQAARTLMSLFDGMARLLGPASHSATPPPGRRTP
jgi:hypothetical protein